MLFHERIARSLRNHGIQTIFGVLGDGNLYMMDDFVRLAGGSYYSMANEAGAVLAANGYARTSGEVGVATVTHGPALTNTVTALAESARDRTPILLIAGDTAVIDRENLQNISQRDVVLCSGAGFEQVRTPETVEEDIARAIRIAVLERKPVVLNVPADFQWREVEEQPAVKPRSVSPQTVRPDPAALDIAAGLVASAARPIVVAGWGASRPDARAALLRLARRIGAPVATSLRGKDLFRGEPHNLGIFGTLTHEIGLDVIGRADTIIAFGAALNRWTAAEGSLLKGKALIHADAERAALNQWFPADAAVVGDAGAVADALVELLDEGGIEPTGFASPELAEQLAARTDADFTDCSTEETVDLRTALLRIELAFPDERTVVTDGGRFVINTFTMLHVPEPSAYVHTLNFGSIGLGMGNAIGAYIGAPERPVLMVCGDGGFMLGGLAEFNTAVRHKIDLVVVVFNDGSYGAEHVQFRNHDKDPSVAMFDWPEIGPVATALGGQGFTVRNLAELDVALKAIPGRDRPILIDIKIDPDKVPTLGH